ncbi:MAG: hypothetical protein R2909_19135 [Gemmatimonadales bacterium]
MTPAQWERLLKLGERFRADPTDARAALAATRIPILAVSGDHDIVFPVENWFALNRKAPTPRPSCCRRPVTGPNSSIRAGGRLPRGLRRAVDRLTRRPAFASPNPIHLEGATR